MRSQSGCRGMTNDQSGRALNVIIHSEHYPRKNESILDISPVLRSCRQGIRGISSERSAFALKFRLFPARYYLQLSTLFARGIHKWGAR